MAWPSDVSATRRATAIIDASNPYSTAVAPRLSRRSFSTFDTSASCRIRSVPLTEPIRNPAALHAIAGVLHLGVSTQFPTGNLFPLLSEWP